MTVDEPVRVVLADDHDLFRAGLHQLLVADGFIEVVGEASAGLQAVALAAEHRPDVVLLDVEMPGQPVQTTLAELRRVVPESKIIILTMHDDAELMAQLLTSGAAGFLAKTVARIELVAAICEMARSSTTDTVTVSLPRAAFLRLDARPNKNALSAREQQVLQLVARAKTNAEIAAELWITEGTVKRHLSNVYAKLQANSRVDAVRKAVAAGILDGYDQE